MVKPSPEAVVVTTHEFAPGKSRAARLAAIAKCKARLRHPNVHTEAVVREPDGTILRQRRCWACLKGWWEILA